MTFYFSFDIDILKYNIFKYRKSNKNLQYIDASEFSIKNIENKLNEITIFEEETFFLFCFLNPKILEPEQAINFLLNKDFENNKSIFFAFCEKPNVFLRKYGKELKPPLKSEFEKIIDSGLKNKKLEDESMYDLIISNSNSCPLTIINNIDKLFYSIDSNIISRADIENIFYKFNEEKVFDILEHILSNDTTKIFSLLQKLAEEKVFGINIINAISNNLFLIKVLFLNNKNPLPLISSSLNIPSWKLFSITKLINLTSLTKVNLLLEKFYEFDYNIKRGEKEPLISFKTLLLNLNNG
jgi:DNA polymerase III delta subunit